MKFIFLIVCAIYLNFCFVYGQSDVKSKLYSIGIEIEEEFLMTKTRFPNSNYFSTKYSNGNISSLLFKNQIVFGNWFSRIDIGYGWIRQNQYLVFSNEIDPIIDFEVTHSLHQWQINYAIGRKFSFQGIFGINIQLGATNYGFFGIDSKNISGWFESDYFDYNTSLWSGQELSETYNYDISYRGQTDIVPWAKFSLTAENKMRSIEIGLSYKYNRMYYQNFITIKSQNYTAIANGRSASNSVGIFINYFF